MITDSRSIPANAELQCDLCIVGAGAAGITLALQLVRSKHSIIVLESGGAKLKAKQQALYHGEVADGAHPPAHALVPVKTSWWLNGDLGWTVRAAGRARFSEASAYTLERMAL